MTSYQTPPVAIVTGASRGFGRALTAALLDLGWVVVGDARRSADIENAARQMNSSHFIAIPGDVTDAGHRDALVAAALKPGPIRLLVNNASSLGPSPPPKLVDYQTGELWSVSLTNLFAP